MQINLNESDVSIQRKRGNKDGGTPSKMDTDYGGNSLFELKHNEINGGKEK